MDPMVKTTKIALNTIFPTLKMDFVSQIIRIRCTDDLISLMWMITHNTMYLYQWNVLVYYNLFNID